MSVIETRCLSSLAKVFADEEPQEQPFLRASALENETFAYQIAYRLSGNPRSLRHVRVRVESELRERITVRSVGLAPSELPCYGDHDEHVLRTQPGLYPDPLYPISPTEGIIVPPDQWRSLWITVALDGSRPAGAYPIALVLESESGEPLAKCAFELDVLPAQLPEQKLIHTEWFHTDCIAQYYGVDVFSEAHWSLVERFVLTAVDHGVNMLLTPLFTPPLDTKAGGERPTVQLVDVIKDGSRYAFGFDRLRRWVEMCDRTGIKYLEFSHLFTQWGAKHAPKIMATEDGRLKRIFGWDTDAAGEAYGQFLAQFLPALVAFVKDSGLEGRCWFHVSDEPALEHLASYSAAAAILHRHVGEFPIVDALSRVEFYKNGLVRKPIPATDHIEPFLAEGIDGLWTYYCCSQYKDVSNRFFNQPSARNRIIGIQLYKYGIEGFLHWGYNFWFSQYSVRPINPFVTTDADHAFPSGDAFLVYPGADGPIESIRMEVLFEALQDLRALELLESLVGRDEVIRLIEELAGEELTFSSYPRNAEWLLAFREEVNRRIVDALRPESLPQAQRS